MINVLPNNDIKPHTEDTTCECHPAIIFESGEMIVVHNAFDGREKKEELVRQIKGQFKNS